MQQAAAMKKVLRPKRGTCERHFLHDTSRCRTKDFLFCFSSERFESGYFEVCVSVQEGIFVKIAISCCCFTSSVSSFRV